MVRRWERTKGTATEAKQVKFPKGGQYFQVQQRLHKIKTDNFSDIGNRSLVSPRPTGGGTETSWSSSNEMVMIKAEITSAVLHSHPSFFFNSSSSSNVQLPAFLINLILLRNREGSDISYLHFSTNWSISPL